MVLHRAMWRSIVVHSNKIPPKDQTSLTSLRERQIQEEAYNKSSKNMEGVSGSILRTLQAPHKIPLAKPRKVVEPVMPYEGAISIKNAYDPRMITSGCPTSIFFPQD